MTCVVINFYSFTLGYGSPSLLYPLSFLLAKPAECRLKSKYFPNYWTYMEGEKMLKRASRQKEREREEEVKKKYI